MNIKDWKCFIKKAEKICIDKDVHFYTLDDCIAIDGGYIEFCKNGCIRYVGLKLLDTIYTYDEMYVILCTMLHIPKINLQKGE